MHALISGSVVWESVGLFDNQGKEFGSLLDCCNPNEISLKIGRSEMEIRKASLRSFLLKLHKGGFTNDKVFSAGVPNLGPMGYILGSNMKILMSN